MKGRAEPPVRAESSSTEITRGVAHREASKNGQTKTTWCARNQDNCRERDEPWEVGPWFLCGKQEESSKVGWHVQLQITATLSHPLYGDARTTDTLTFASKSSYSEWTSDAARHLPPQPSKKFFGSLEKTELLFREARSNDISFPDIHPRN